MKSQLEFKRKREANEPSPAQSPRKTDHALARAYSERGWGKYGSRADWENSLRYQGVFHL